MNLRRIYTTICGGKKGVLIALMLVVASFVPSAAPVLAADANETLLEGVARLEKTIGVTPDPKTPLSERLSVLERHVFGFAQDGSLVTRFEHLRKTTDRPTEKLGTNVTEQVSIDDSLPSASLGGSLVDSLPLLNAIPPNFLRIEPPNAVLKVEPDYFSEVMASSDGKILRFKNMPIPVFINAFPDRNFITCVVRGFEVWEDRTQGAVRFVQVDDATKARIQVVWKRLGRDQDGSGCMLGAHTITKYTPNSKGSVSVFTISGVPVPMYVPKLGPKYTVPPQVIEVNLDLVMSKAPTIRYRLLQNVISHELGHALGLLGHSKNQTDLMYTVTDEHSRLSERDINTLLRVYQQKVDVPL